MRPYDDEMIVWWCDYMIFVLSYSSFDLLKWYSRKPDRLIDGLTDRCKDRPTNKDEEIGKGKDRSYLHSGSEGYQGIIISRVGFMFFPWTLWTIIRRVSFVQWRKFSMCRCLQYNWISVYGEHYEMRQNLLCHLEIPKLAIQQKMEKN